MACTRKSGQIIRLSAWTVAASSVPFRMQFDQVQWDRARYFNYPGVIDRCVLNEPGEYLLTFAASGIYPTGPGAVGPTVVGDWDVPVGNWFPNFYGSVTSLNQIWQCQCSIAIFALAGQTASVMLGNDASISYNVLKAQLTICKI